MSKIMTNKYTENFTCMSAQGRQKLVMTGASTRTGHWECRGCVAWF